MNTNNKWRYMNNSFSIKVFENGKIFYTLANTYLYIYHNNTVLITIDKIAKRICVDKLVFETFNKLVSECYDIVHIDGNQHNNHLKNLKLEFKNIIIIPNNLPEWKNLWIVQK